jgi:ABC-2 type transport system ATP-binding protein
MEENALQIKNLIKEYSGIRAVDDISFNVKKGDFFGFLGKNGAGKSTTIHCIVGIAKLTSGNIKIFGKDVEKDYRESRRLVGLSPQEFNVDQFGTVTGILDFVAGYYGMRKKQRKERIDELLENFDLKKYANKEFRMLSGGFKRRVMLARAMMHDPELLILDEPTAGVDVELRHELWDYLKKINESGKTIFLTSHYLDEVELLCDKLAIIKNGKIVSVGTKKELLKDGKSLEEKYLEITKEND